jgi:hypothetical protein
MRKLRGFESPESIFGHFTKWRGTKQNRGSGECCDMLQNLSTRFFERQKVEAGPRNISLRKEKF